MKIIYYLGNQHIYYGISSMITSIKKLCRKLIIEETSDKIITIDNLYDEIYIDRITKIISDYFHITSMEIYTDYDWQKLNADDINNLIKNNSRIEDISSVLKKLETTLFWAKNKRNAPLKKMVNYVFSIIRNISMEYDERRKPVSFSVGDIVETNFGFNLPGEISGSRVHSIISHIDEDLVYVTPIIPKEYAEKLKPNFFIALTNPNDIEYLDTSFLPRIALLRKSRYIRFERITSKIGVASPSFMKYLISELPKAFDFRNE